MTPAAQDKSGVEWVHVGGVWLRVPPVDTKQRDTLRRHLPAFLAGTLRMAMDEARALAETMHPDAVERLRAELEDAQLARIEAQNPGIDMEEVKQKRATS